MPPTVRDLTAAGKRAALRQRSARDHARRTAATIAAQTGHGPAAPSAPPASPGTARTAAP